MCRATAIGSVHLFGGGAMTRVFAVDPGLTRCGVAVVDGGPGRALRMMHVDVISTDAGLPLAQRLLGIEVQVARIIAAHSPDIVAVERVFSQHNVASAMATAQAAAVVLLIGARSGLPTAQHTPTEVKAAVTGSGRADKAQVASMVTRLLGLAAPPRPVDATDALALAICHLWRMPMLERIRVAEVV